MGDRKVIYVYSGSGVSETCRDVVFKTLTSLVHPDYHTVLYIQPEDVCLGQWKQNAALIVFGGGYDVGYTRALNTEGVQQIRVYVESGGCYLGLCAGGYFGCDRIQFDKCGPLEVCRERHLKFFPGVCKGPVFPGFEYSSFKGAKAASVTYKPLSGEPFSFSSYYNGGGQFSVYEAKESKVEILAKYNDLPNTPAAIVKCDVGDGGVAVLTGIHPEYECSVLPEDDVFVQTLVGELESCDEERIDCIADLLRYLRVTVRTRVSVSSES